MKGDICSIKIQKVPKNRKWELYTYMWVVL